MPLLNRRPEAHHAAGLLILLALVLAVTAARNWPFFLHAMGVH
ncbi:MAG: hypothetical protein P4M01_04835 [Acidobacteriota bacterium]|nr:hypothetical protein [Acidobacteriota bacterium]